MRYLKSLALSFLLLVSFAFPALAGPNVDLGAGYYNGYQTIRGQIKIDGQVLKTDVPPLVIKGRVMLPVRAIAEALGAKVDYIPERQAAYIVKGNRTVVFYGGSDKFQFNNAWVSMDVQVQTIDGRFMVPLRYLGMFLDYTMNYDEVTGDVLVESGPDVPVNPKPISESPSPSSEQQPSANESSPATQAPVTENPTQEQLPAQELPTNEDIEGLPDSYKIISFLSGISINGEKINTSVPGIVVRGPEYFTGPETEEVMVPLTEVAQALGADVQPGYAGVVYLNSGNIKAAFRSGYNTAQVSSSSTGKIDMVMPAFLYKNHLMVGYRYLAQTLKISTLYNPQDATVDFISQNSSTQPGTESQSLQVKPEDYAIMHQLGDIYLNNNHLTTKVPAVVIRGPNWNGIGFIQRDFVPIADLARAAGYNVIINGNKIVFANNKKRIVFEVGSRYYDYEYTNGDRVNYVSMDMPALTLNGQLIVEGIAAGKALDLTPDYSYDSGSYNYFTWDYNKDKDQNLLEPEPPAQETPPQQEGPAPEDSNNTDYQVDPSGYQVIEARGEIRVDGKRINTPVPPMTISGLDFEGKLHNAHFVPAEGLAEALGFTMTVEGDKISFRKDNKIVTSNVGTFKYQFLRADGTSVINIPSLSPIVTVNGHVMIPAVNVNYFFDTKSANYDPGDGSWDFKTK
ncbi:hypothetical protein MTAT_18950 [Moorella thermoacetica]|uniref:Copper amine oxidase-like N-terminal domain-containing protein n=1 Tax=Neomoorella thermoacetica TaxID=1525 RepID=A0AAC9HI33_NEOTH|nr:stalk domain-containing protein [Moorella thermoacetica]AOQ24552.1 hypothetical protein Maut_02122 [Moorella thermoacetica]TYL12653.1 hypothetical protein MTAT_18950 [Moorella thermoacetica]